MTRDTEVFLVVRRGDEYLVVHRVPEGGAYWHGIAGGVEPGESPGAAAARELREETGFAAEPVSLEAPFAYAGVTVHTFLVEVPPGWEPDLNEEHDDYRWLPRDEAVELLYWPEPKELIRTISGT
ncbi:MAG TPA: NUDIX domain-containing protein [Gaiellaceae bacterium]|nr:NUDIX domain-containing protein [Gaiellaceae bacterium]